jgi:hypothetical protein
VPTIELLIGMIGGWKSIDVPPWPTGLSEQTVDYLARQP